MKNAANYFIQNVKIKMKQIYNLSSLIIINFLINYVECVFEKLRKINNFYSEIYLFVQAEGHQSFLSEKYNDEEPFEIILNGKVINDYNFELGKGKNNITLKFDKQIENC